MPTRNVSVLRALLAPALAASALLAPPLGAVARAEEPGPSLADESTPGIGAAAGRVGEPERQGFPAGTRSLRVRVESSVLSGPRAWSPHLGRITADTRVGWREVVEADRGAECPRWVAIAPRGWLCATDLEPSPLEPTTALYPAVAEGGILPSEFRGLGPIAPDPGLVDTRGRRTCMPAGPRTPDDLPYDVADFAGVRLDCPDVPPLPLAWAQDRVDVAAEVPVYSAPQARAAIVRHLAPRELVTPGEVSKDGLFTAIGPDAWVATASLHAARVAPPPQGVGPRERWIDIDVTEQVLVAYEGTTPVYATLVSTGTPTHPTPGGVFRVGDKRALAIMQSIVGGVVAYRGVVPWTMYYAPNFALHAAYWHDRFGARMSHGCVNLAPLDARVLFQWAGPELPDGWMIARDTVESPGSVVRVHRGPVRRVGRAPAIGTSLTP